MRWITAQAHWPGVVLAEADFVEHCARHFTPDGELPELHFDDLYLARASAEGDGAALAVLEQQCLPALRDALRAVNSSQNFADEVLQAMRLRLLLGEGERGPRVLDYAGRGPLQAWLRITAVHLGLSLLRSEGRAQRRRDEFEGLAPQTVGDPELDYLRMRYRGEFEAAFRHACAALPERERAALRLTVVDGLKLEQIGIIYGVHRATAARWIARARAFLNEDIRRRLSDLLRLSPSEFGSLARLVRSQLDLQLSVLLGDSPS